MSFKPEVWGEAEFSGAQLSDRRRVRRVVTIASALARKPGASIPQLFENFYDVKAAYNLFDHPEATPDVLQAGHRSQVQARMGEPGSTTLLLEDTSELSWNQSEPISGLGPVGQGRDGDQGFLLHTVLSVRWAGAISETYRRPPLDVLGIADQRYHVRRTIPAGEDGDDSRQRKLRERESCLWMDTSQRLGPAPDVARWIRVGDRGADIYEVLRDCRQYGHGFVIRASQDRALAQEKQRLFDVARSAPALGSFDFTVRPQRRGQSPRVTCLSVSAQRVQIRSPKRPGVSPGRLEPIECTVVRVWEEPSPGVKEPLEWILLVDDVVENFESARTAALQYATRWFIEEFHKALKTGLGAERLQLEAANRLFAAIAIMSVVAWRLVLLKEQGRIEPDAPAEAAGLEPFELKVLSLRLKRKLQTVRDVMMAVGRLGGHLNRTSDGFPGLITLWRGLKELQALVAGARLGLQLGDLGND